MVTQLDCQLLTFEEAAELLRVSPDVVKRLVESETLIGIDVSVSAAIRRKAKREGKRPRVPDNHRGRWRVRTQDLLAFIHEQIEQDDPTYVRHQKQKRSRKPRKEHV